MKFLSLSLGSVDCYQLSLNFYYHVLQDAARLDLHQKHVTQPPPAARFISANSSHFIAGLNEFGSTPLIKSLTNCFSSNSELVITTKDLQPQRPERAGRCNRLHPVVWCTPYDYFMLHHTLEGLERHRQLICITSPPWGKLATFSFKK